MSPATPTTPRTPQSPHAALAGGMVPLTPESALAAAQQAQQAQQQVEAWAQHGQRLEAWAQHAQQLELWLHAQHQAAVTAIAQAQATGGGGNGGASLSGGLGLGSGGISGELGGLMRCRPLGAPQMHTRSGTQLLPTPPTVLHWFSVSSPCAPVLFLLRGCLVRGISVVRMPREGKSLAGSAFTARLLPAPCSLQA
jgi:hypothetical protein